MYRPSKPSARSTNATIASECARTHEKEANASAPCNDDSVGERSLDTGQKIFRIKPEKWLQGESEARSWISVSREECFNHAFNVTTLGIIFDRKIYTIVTKQESLSLSLMSYNGYIDNDAEFNSIWMNCQSSNKELSTKSHKQKTKCIRLRNERSLIVFGQG